MCAGSCALARVCVCARADSESYKDALRRAFRGLNRAIVFFEIFTASGRHAHIQAVPVPMDASAMHVRSFFEREAEAIGCKFEQISGKIGERIREQDDFFFSVELPDSSSLLLLASNTFPMQFGRDVIARHVMRQPKRANWKNCALDQRREIAIAEEFKRFFAPFEPS